MWCYIIIYNIIHGLCFAFYNFIHIWRWLALDVVKIFESGPPVKKVAHPWLIRCIIGCCWKPLGQVELRVVGGCAAQVKFNCEYISCYFEQEAMWIYSWQIDTWCWDIKFSVDLERDKLFQRCTTRLNFKILILRKNQNSIARQGATSSLLS